MSVLFLSLLLSACQEPVLTITKDQDLTQNSPTSAASPTSSPSTDPFSEATQATLQGVVQEAGTQKLLSGITVRLNERSQITDEAGFFRFSDQAAGAAKLIVAAPNYINVNRNIQLTAALQTEDILLTPEDMPQIEPSPSPSTIILLPDGTATTAPPATASPSPSPSPTASPTTSPTETPNPSPSSTVNELNQAANADVLIQTKAADLRLTFTLNKANGLPVNWNNQTVYVEYYIATSDSVLLTSGKSLIVSSGDGFVVSLGGRTATPTVEVKIDLLLPNQQVLRIKKTARVQGT